MKHAYAAFCEPLTLQPLEHRDIEILMRLRNDKQLSQYLRKIKFITPEIQEKWFQDYLNEQNHYCWSIIFELRTIGSLAIYDIEDTKAEIGKIMIDPKYQGRGFAYQSFLMAILLGFKFLDIKTFCLTVHENNLAARKTYEKIGFRVMGRRLIDNVGNELEMQLDNAYFWKENVMLEDIVLIENYI